MRMGFPKITQSLVAENGLEEEIHLHVTTDQDMKP